MCVLILSTIFVWDISHSKKNWAGYDKKNVYWSCPILTKLEFSGQFSKNPQISNLMKIRPVGDEFHADERTDMTKLIITFRNFANAPKTN
jgi:hypothetical protein